MFKFFVPWSNQSVDLSVSASFTPNCTKNWLSKDELSSILCLLLTRGMACVGKCFERKISKPTKLDCKQNFYCTVYYITLNSNCEAQRASKNLKKIVEDRVGSQK